QPADDGAHASARPQLARLSAVHTGEKPQQRGLSGPVRTDHRHLVAGLHAERHPAQRKGSRSPRSTEPCGRTQRSREVAHLKQRLGPCHSTSRNRGSRRRSTVHPATSSTPEVIAARPSASGERGTPPSNAARYESIAAAIGFPCSATTATTSSGTAIRASRQAPTIAAVATAVAGTGTWRSSGAARTSDAPAAVTARAKARHANTPTYTNNRYAAGVTRGRMNSVKTSVNAPLSSSGSTSAQYRPTSVCRSRPARSSSARRHTTRLSM